MTFEASLELRRKGPPALWGVKDFFRCTLFFSGYLHDIKIQNTSYILVNIPLLIATETTMDRANEILSLTDQQIPESARLPFLPPSLSLLLVVSWPAFHTHT